MLYFIVLSATWMGDSYKTAISILHTNIGYWDQVALCIDMHWDMDMMDGGMSSPKMEFEPVPLLCTHCLVF